MFSPEHACQQDASLASSEEESDLRWAPCDTPLTFLRITTKAFFVPGQTKIERWLTYMSSTCYS